MTELDQNQKSNTIFVQHCWCVARFGTIYTNVKNTRGGVLILVKLQALACNFTKINTPPWLFFTFFTLYKWYQIAQRTTCKKISLTLLNLACL